MNIHRCRLCGVEKSIFDFDKKIADGPYEHWNLRRCKECTHKDYLERYANKDRRSAMNRASRNWKRNHPTRHAELARIWRSKNKDKIRSVNRLNYAIRKGVVKRLPCEVCGAYGQAHHDSYEIGNELEVRWLCQKHHKLWHQIIDELKLGDDLDERFLQFVCSIKQPGDSNEL